MINICANICKIICWIIQPKHRVIIVRVGSKKQSSLCQNCDSRLASQNLTLLKYLSLEARDFHLSNNKIFHRVL